MKYFSNFPSINYSLDDNDLEFKLIKNPLTRVRFVREILQNVKIFYEYDFSDSDSPEIIAHKLYEDPNRYWMVMFSNDLIDPYYDVPLKDADLDSLLVHKYGSVANAQSQIHHYERRTNIVTNKDGNISENEYVTELQQYSYDFDTGVVIENTLPTISNPVSISSESTEVVNDGVIITKTVKDYAISNYDYELNLNEDKRKIKLVRSELVSEIETQFKSLLNR
jgi:hypothetical protein